MEFKGSQSRFSAGRLSHYRAVRLAQFIGLNAVLIKEEHVEGVIDHDDAEVVDIAWLKRPKVHNDARTGVDVKGGRKRFGRLRKATRGGTTNIGVDGQRRCEKKEDQAPSH
jgi:hypothetical protein